MRKTLIIAILVLLVATSFLAGSWSQKKRSVGNISQGARQVLYYVDPMNPALKSDKPGIAPCGMPLEPVYANGSPDLSRMPPGTVNVSSEQQQLIGLKVATVEKAPWSHTVRVLGRVVPDETLIYRINSATDGWVKKVFPVTTGSLVRRDELLATFFSPDFFPAIKAYLYGLRALDRFESNEKETKEQIEVTNVSIGSYRVSLRNLGMSEHQIDAMTRTRQGVDEIEIRAPEQGFIIARNISLGQRFERGTELYRIADLSHIWVLADVFENESEHFRPGIIARVILPNQKKSFHARVSNTIPQFDAASRTLKIRLEVDNPGFLLRPDMFVDVELPVTFPRAITIPIDAVRYSGMKKTVYMDLGKGFFEPRDVETGWRFGDRVEIVRGLLPGDRIVVSGNFLIDSESRMRAAASGTYGTAQKDPVCGMDVDEGSANAGGKTSEYGGRKYYFCSEACKQQFDRDPEHFLKKSSAGGRHGTFTTTKMEAVRKASVHKDLVCGMDVEEDAAKAVGRTSEYRGKQYYFCSDSCKRQFEKDPESYTEVPEVSHRMTRAVSTGGGND
jgi:membrane fusion protein, copper/silver efflux system